MIAVKTFFNQNSELLQDLQFFLLVIDILPQSVITLFRQHPEILASLLCFYIQKWKQDLHCRSVFPSTIQSTYNFSRFMKSRSSRIIPNFTSNLIIFLGNHTHCIPFLYRLHIQKVYHFNYATSVSETFTFRLVLNCLI